MLTRLMAVAQKKLEKDAVRWMAMLAQEQVTFGSQANMPADNTSPPTWTDLVMHKQYPRQTAWTYVAATEGGHERNIIGF